MKKNGFTLIELAIVLAILGIMIGGGFKILKMQREKERTVKAKEDVLTAKNAIVGNTILNNNTLPTVAFFDQNLSPITDPNHQLLYVPATALLSTNACALQTTSLSITKPNGSSVSNVAFIVVSEAANYNMQTALSGNSVTLHNPSEKVDDNTTPINRVERYDDVYDWMTLAQLQEEIKCSNNPLHIVNTSLPDTDTANAPSYNVPIVVDGNYSAASLNCTFTPPNRFTQSGFSIIYAGPSPAGSTTVVDCQVSADGKTVNKKFTINVNP